MALISIKYSSALVQGSKPTQISIATSLGMESDSDESDYGYLDNEVELLQARFQFTLCRFNLIKSVKMIILVVVPIIAKQLGIKLCRNSSYFTYFIVLRGTFGAFQG